jgi:ComF family protein
MTEIRHVVAASWRSRVQQAANSLMDLVLPSTCAVCRQVGDLLCRDCRATLPRIETALCTRCGRTLADNSVTYCQRCARQPLLLEYVRTPFFFEDPLSGIIHQLKYNGLFALAKPVADLMADAWPEAATNVDVIVPIPLHEQRQKVRGYNQAALLARRLGQRWDVPVSEDGLQRSRYTQPQVGLSLAERQRNVTGAFTAVTAAFAGQRVLLVDDVYTTGSTLTAATKVLLEAGAVFVWGYCAARAMRRFDRDELGKINDEG